MGLAAVSGQLGALGPGIGVGIIFAAYIQASARQPESAGANRTWLIFGFAVVEALALFGLVLAFALS
jgi:F-type H+-transporting ATPase subunit c